MIEAAHAALDRWGFGMASVRFICGTQSIHTRARAAHLGVPGHRGHDPLLVVLRRQRRSLRVAAHGRGRRHLRRAEPRLGDRRHPPVQGAPAAIPKRRHGRPRAVPDRGRGCPPPADRHRRRLLDGRLPRRPRRHLRPGRAARRARHGRRLPCGRVRRPARPRDARALRRGRPRRRPHRDAREGDGRRLAAGTRRAGARSSRSCASARAPTSSRTAWRRRSSAPRWRRSTCSSRRTTCAPAWPRTRPGSAIGWSAPASRCSPASTRSCR